MAIAQLMLERTGDYEPDYLYFAAHYLRRMQKSTNPNAKGDCIDYIRQQWNAFLLRPRI